MKKYLGLMFVLSLVLFGAAKSFAVVSVAPISANVSVSRNLSLGSRGDDVKALQLMLKQKGFLFANATGYYGTLTKEAVRRYQKSLSFTSITGTVGPKTIEMIKKELPTVVNSIVTSNEKDIPANTIIKADDIHPLPPVKENYLTLLSPNGGETWKKGETQRISWKDTSSTVTPKAYDITISNYYPPCAVNCPLRPIKSPYFVAQKVIGNSFDWVVGNVTNSSADLSLSDGVYTIDVCVAGTGTCDSSNSYFTISSATKIIIPLPTYISPSITILSPNGGETFVVGKSITIKWTSQNISSSNQMTISLYVPETGQHYFLAGPHGNFTNNDWVETFTIPSTVPSGAYVVAISTEPRSDMATVIDYSDNKFYITN